MAKFETDESAFNFAVEYLKQISESLKMCKYSAQAKDVDYWYDALRTVYRELSVKTNDEEDKEFEEAFKEITKMLNSDDRYEKHPEIMYYLDRLEIKCRKTLQQKGMLLPGKSDPKFAVLER